MRIGLIGVGRIGAFHAQTLTDLPAVDEIIITDAAPDLARRVGERLDVRVAPEPADVLTSGVDGIIIASSTATHPDFIRACVRAGIPTFCEKPVAALSEEAVALRDELAGNDTPIQIGFPRRFDAAYMAARADVVAGTLGYVHTVRSTTLDPAPPPEAYIRGSGGIFNDCAIHDFDAVRYVTGQEVVEVYAAGTNQGVDYIEAAGDAESVTSILTMTGGTLAVVSNSRSNGRGHDVRLEVLGSKDSVAAGLDDRLPLRSADPAVAFPSGTPWNFFMDRFADAFRAELTAFTQVVAGALPSPCTLHDGVEASLIAEAATRSWREHRPVRLDDVR
ncbi:Gfo/Idh/MocA family oxidoreductase [Nonomuraea sp. NEAU-A123]|uniref:Gfo/Idh/MocA family protein n=1 Tax=Nonomuraea sp. NEAU-A123 TaxID=2839649 RepID=UPI001BE43A34|nr:Gfo/Idh/MocA family oxidoreductase [Nonomuraea sp. NEAU-A123]MBT2225283.1 Gfo/Idh/MocA family oxidoreductase [Nonomuraea sp. NEAU-A123]